MLLFVEEYLKDLDGQAAAIRAGYAPKSARITASQLLADFRIGPLVKAAMEKRAARIRIDADEVLRQLAALVKSSVKHYTIDDAGQVALADDAPPDAWFAVASVKHKIRSTEHGVTREVELKLWDKNSALDKAMRHLGLLKDLGVSGPKKVVFILRPEGKRFADVANAVGDSID